MDADAAINVGMKIAEAHTAAVLDIYKVKPDATPPEALRGTQVWLAAEIMKAIHEALAPKGKNLERIARRDLERTREYPRPRKS